MSKSKSKQPNPYMLRNGTPKVFASPINQGSGMPSPEQMQVITTQVKKLFLK